MQGLHDFGHAIKQMQDPQDFPRPAVTELLFHPLRSLPSCLRLATMHRRGELEGGVEWILHGLESPSNCARH
jgi:hypothetical protein